MLLCPRKEVVSLEDIILPTSAHARYGAWIALNNEQQFRVRVQENAYFRHLKRIQDGIPEDPLGDWLAAEMEVTALMRDAADRVRSDRRPWPLPAHQLDCL